MACEFDSRVGYMAYAIPVDKQKKELARARYKMSIVARYKKIKGCMDCGYNAHSAALEFDHMPGIDKTRTVASLMYASWKVIKEEIRKCEVVCANCHAVRTMTRMGLYA